jgi:heterodisulfide reductase subunit C
MALPALEFEHENTQTLIQEVMARSEQNITACYQCRRCAAGCPVGEETGYVTPDRLIRMILLGDREQALSNKLVWKCVSCYTCGTRCPNEIQTAKVTETLKHMSKEEHLDPLLPKVAAFHKSFCAAANHLGRLNEIEFMGLYEMKNTFRNLIRFKFKEVFNETMQQLKLGMMMTKKKRMHFGIQKVKNLSDLKRLLKKAKKSGSQAEPDTSRGT